MKITIPKPMIEQEVHEEDKEDNCGQNGDTELGKENGDVAAEAEEDLSKPIDAGGGIGGEEAPNESIHANGNQNGVEHNEGDGDGKEEAGDEEGEEEEVNREKNAKPGAKSTTVIIARTHPGESNTSFIVQGGAVIM